MTDEGRSLFVEKRCVTCHVVGRGVFVGPDLWKVNNKYSKTDIISWISNTDAIYKKYNKTVSYTHLTLPTILLV